MRLRARAAVDAMSAETTWWKRVASSEIRRRANWESAWANQAAACDSQKAGSLRATDYSMVAFETGSPMKEQGSYYTD